MKIITLSGKAQNGKDSSAEIIKTQLESKGKRVLIVHYADMLKYICKTFLGWNGVKDEDGRTLLQIIGTDVVRRKDPDFWVNSLLNILKFFPDLWDYVLIPDCRFPNEIEKIKENGFECESIRVVRNNYNSGLTNEQLNHPSETALDNFVFDYVINNNGTYAELVNNIKQLVKDWR